MEILIVIAIIGILAATVVPVLNSAREKALVAKVQVELEGVKSAMVVLHDDTGVYSNGVGTYCRSGVDVPANNEVDLATNNAGLVANGSSWTGWNGPYVSAATDPWGTSYFLDEDYDCLAATEGCKGLTDTTSVLVSCGPNADNSGANGSCAYDTDNVVIRLCD